jgi:hypothetical protein
MTPEEKQDYIRKRAIVLQALERLFGYWDLAEGLHLLIGSPHATPESIDKALEMLVEAADSAKHEAARAKMLEGVRSMRNLKDKENSEREEEMKATEAESKAQGESIISF